VGLWFCPSSSLPGTASSHLQEVHPRPHYLSLFTFVPTHHPFSVHFSAPPHTPSHSSQSTCRPPIFLHMHTNWIPASLCIPLLSFLSSTAPHPAVPQPAVQFPNSGRDSQEQSKKNQNNLGRKQKLGREGERRAGRTQVVGEPLQSHPV
jgi:hypothetical protein